jgi:hypothetical protein
MSSERANKYPSRSFETMERKVHWGELTLRAWVVRVLENYRQPSPAVAMSCRPRDYDLNSFMNWHFPYLISLAFLS